VLEVLWRAALGESCQMLVCACDRVHVDPGACVDEGEVVVVEA
jgi:hypothetical protein